MRNYIILNGVNSNTISGLLISTLPPITKPKIRTQTEEIDGRDGDIVTKLGYSAYDKIIEIGLYGNFDINEVISYFSTEGTVVFSNEADKYYNYQILDQIDYEKLIRFKTAKVKMHVQPFKYPLQEEQIQVDATVVQASGTDIRLEYTTPNASIETEVEGKAEQHSYSGKNKANTTGNPEFVYNATQYEKNGATVIVKNNTSNITKTYAFVEYYIDNLKPNTTYTISFDATIGNNGYISCDIMKVRDSSDGSSQLLRINGSSSGHFTGQFTTPDDTSTMSINLYSLRGTYYANASVTYSNVQIEEGSSETSYEPYVGGTPSPNPDYPQEIKTVSGIGNLFDINTLVGMPNVTVSGNKLILAGSSDYHATPSGVNLKDIANLEVGKTYTLSFNTTYTGNNANKIYLRGSASYWTNETSLTITQTMLDDRIAFYGTNDSEISNIQIEEGTIAHQYVPYGHWLPVKVSNKNLFDGIIELGTISSTGVPTSSDSVIRSKNFTKVEEGNVVISYENGPTGIVVYGYDKNYNFIMTFPLHTTSTTGLENAMIVNIPENIEYIKFRFNTGFTTTSIKVQIEQNSTATPYIEHQEQTTLIDLNKYDENNDIVGNYEICSIGDTKDLLTIKDGRAKITKNIDKILLNGSESWADRPNYNSADRFVVSALIYAKSGSYGGYSNYFYSKNPNDQTGYPYIAPNSTQIIVNFSEKNTTTLQEFKTWLSTHNTEFYYQLATPEEITLSGEYDIRAYREVTNMTTEGNIIPVINAKTSGMPNTIVTNIGNIYAKPLITIYGSGDIGVYLNNQHVLQIALGDSGSITIDVSKMEAYDKNTKVLMNRLVTGDYMKFLINSGENEIAFSGTVAGFTMDNYTRWL